MSRDFGNWRSERAQEVLARHAVEQQEAGVTDAYNTAMETMITHPGVEKFLTDMEQETWSLAIADGFRAGIAQTHPLVPHTTPHNYEPSLSIGKFDIGLLKIVALTDRQVITWKYDRQLRTRRKELQDHFTSAHALLLFEQIVELESHGLATTWRADLRPERFTR